MIIGSHVSFGKEQLLSSVKETIKYNANTFMFYTGAPQNTMRSPINDLYTLEAYKLMQENNIKLENIICHAPYIINLANNTTLEKYDFAKKCLRIEIERCSTLGVKFLVLHPGSAVGIDRQIALDNIVRALNDTLLDNDNICICLETMAGKGTELGINLNEMSYLVNSCKYQDKIGICLDTCHLNDSGVNIEDFDNYLMAFDKLIGIHKIKCIHINDSKNELASHKDRHENIGFGTIGFDNLLKVINNPKIKDVPKILETPFIGEYPPYKFEIEAIKNKEINDNLLDDVINYYKNL